MKKLFIAALFVLAIGSSAFAIDGTKKVSRQTENSFNILFPGASNVSWEQSEKYFSASFTLDAESLTAYFSKDGELIGTSQQVDIDQLPSKGLRRIKKDYSNYKITDAIKFDQDDRSNFYVMVEQGNCKQILEVSPYGNVTVFKGKIK